MSAVPEGPGELYDDAPCGLLSVRPDGTVETVNRTLLRWTGHDRAALVGTQFRELLAVGDRIFYETHYSPLLQMQDEVRELALTLVCPRGRLPVFLNSVLDRAPGGAPRGVRIAVFLAVDQRSYEAELVVARRRAEESEARVQELARTLQNSLLPPALPRVGRAGPGGGLPAGRAGRRGRRRLLRRLLDRDRRLGGRHR